jgi:PAS domain S-box-containing protein
MGRSSRRSELSGINTQDGKALIATDLRGHITFWNRRAEDLFGWKSDEVLGRNVLDVLLHKKSREDGAEIMSKLLRGRSWSGKFEAKRRDGISITVNSDHSPIYTRGEMVGLIHVSWLQEKRQSGTQKAL